MKRALGVLVLALSSLARPLSISAQIGAGAQTTAQQTTQLRQWLAEADSLAGTDAAATLDRTRRILAATPAASSTPDLSQIIARALVLRCRAATDAMKDSVIAFADAGLRSSAITGDAVRIASLRICRGAGYEAAGRLKDAMAEYSFGVQEGARLRNDELRADALVHRGEQRYYIGELSGAVEDLTEAYKLYDKLKDEPRRLNTLNAMANIYAEPRVGQFDRALEYYRLLLNAHTASGSQELVAEDYFNIGSTLDQQGKSQEALVEFGRGLALDLQRGDQDEVATDRRAIGIVLYKLKRPAEALRMFDLALEHARRTGNIESIAALRLSRGIALRMLGRTAEALPELDAARQQFVAENSKRFLQKAESERALVLEALGRWREAYMARTADMQLRDSLNAQGRGEQTSRLRLEFDVELKEKENRALQLESDLRAQKLNTSTRIRRLQLAVLILSSLVIFALSLLAWRQIRHARRLNITSLTDDLTGLPNRRHLLLLASEEFRNNHTNRAGLGVLAIDIDHFKRINDTYGHAAGDAVLRAVAQSLTATLRGGDHVGRTGGEEFIALLPRASHSAADDVANRVREAIAKIDFSELAGGLAVTASIGVAVAEDADRTFGDVSKRADEMLYRAKASGRNRVVVAAGM